MTTTTSASTSRRHHPFADAAAQGVDLGAAVPALPPTPLVVRERRPLERGRDLVGAAGHGTSPTATARCDGRSSGVPPPGLLGESENLSAAGNVVAARDRVEFGAADLLARVPVTQTPAS